MPVAGYDVTRALQARGYKVVAVQNSLFSYAKDIETTKRVLDAQQGRSSWSALLGRPPSSRPQRRAIQRQVARVRGSVRTRFW